MPRGVEVSKCGPHHKRARVPHLSRGTAGSQTCSRSEPQLPRREVLWALARRAWTYISWKERVHPRLRIVEMNGCLHKCRLNQEFGAVILTEQRWVCVITIRRFTKAQAPRAGVGGPTALVSGNTRPSLPCPLLPWGPPVVGGGGA